MHAAIGVAGGSGESEASRQIVDRSPVEHGRIIEAEGGRHAVAELPRALDVVHAGDGVMAGEQARGVVAWITMPGRRIGRGRLYEGEAGELDEHELDRDGALARGVKQARGRTRARRSREQERVDRVV